jgi:hypothetical protein
MIIGILLLFAVIFVLVMAFKSPKQQVTVRKIDQDTGKESVEIHETNQSSAGRTAARATLGIIFIPIGLVLFIVLIVAIGGSFIPMHNQLDQPVDYSYTPPAKQAPAPTTPDKPVTKPSKPAPDMNLVYKGIQVLRNMARDPDSFGIDRIMFWAKSNPTREYYYYEYHAKNGFGGMNREAVAIRRTVNKKGEEKFMMVPINTPDKTAVVVNW